MDDQQTPNKSIYEASYKDIVLKNFLAGFSRAVGGMVITLVFWAFAAYTFITYAWPQIEPFVNEYLKAVDTINQMQQNPTTLQYQQFLQDINSSLPR